MTGRFAGKVVLVTGAAQGIGEAIAHRFASEGATLGICDINGDGVAALAALLDPEGDKIVAQKIDVTVREEIEAFVARIVYRFGRLDVLVNNTGGGGFGHVDEITPEAWRHAFALTVDAAFYASRVAMPHLVAAQGCVVNTGSISGLYGDYGLVAYNSAKGALANLTRNMAIDHGPDGVRVNAVAPGGVRTQGATILSDNPAFQREYRRLIPLGRMAEPSEVAGAVAFLASEDASYITGHNLVIDGGVTAATGQPNFRRIFAEQAEAAQ